MINKLKNKINILIESEEFNSKLDFFTSIMIIALPVIFTLLNK